MAEQRLSFSRQVQNEHQKQNPAVDQKWMQHGLWLVALVFARFLSGLGDLPKVERQLTLDDFMDQRAATALRSSIKATEAVERDADTALE